MAQGLLIPIIAVVTTYIAIQQWNATKMKLRIERYERRLRIYQLTQRFIIEVITTTRPEVHKILEFYSETAEADFIFTSEIRKYIDEVFSHANKLNQANTLYKSFNANVDEAYDHAEICESLRIHITWFSDQAAFVREVFKPHLDLTR